MGICGIGGVAEDTLTVPCEAISSCRTVGETDPLRPRKVLRFFVAFPALACQGDVAECTLKAYGVCSGSQLSVFVSNSSLWDVFMRPYLLMALFWRRVFWDPRSAVAMLPTSPPRSCRHGIVTLGEGASAAAVCAATYG